LAISSVFHVDLWLLVSPPLLRRNVLVGGEDAEIVCKKVPEPATTSKEVIIRGFGELM
jgi:hypothetical protein